MKTTKTTTTYTVVDESGAVHSFSFEYEYQGESIPLNIFEEFYLAECSCGKGHFVRHDKSKKDSLYKVSVYKGDIFCSFVNLKTGELEKENHSTD